MSQQYHESHRASQDRFDTRRLADRLAESTSDVIREPFEAFIEECDMFFIATADEHGWPGSSYKGGEPGFVRVVDEHTLVFPVYNGNGMFLTAGNLTVNPASVCCSSTSRPDSVEDERPRVGRPR